MKYLQLEPRACPECGKVVDTMTGMNTTNQDELPNPGSVQVCLYCGHLQVFGEDKQWREPTDEEHYDIATDPYIKRLQELRMNALKEKKQ